MGRKVAVYSIGQIEELTGVKSHVLRYWEEVIPSIAPQKTVGGHREYSQKELEQILRLKFLIYEKKYTVEGARNQLISECDSVTENADVMFQIQALRKELADLYFEVTGEREK